MIRCVPPALFTTTISDSVPTGCDHSGDGFDDLAIGVPGANIGAIADAGAVNVLYGSGAGLSADGDQVWHQATAGIKGIAEAGDLTGFSVGKGHPTRDPTLSLSSRRMQAAQGRPTMLLAGAVAVNLAVPRALYFRKPLSSFRIEIDSISGYATTH